MPSNPMKLKHVLILPFILLISLAVLVTSFLTWKYSEKATVDLGNEISKQSALRTKEKLDYYLNNAKASNKLLKQVIEYNLVDTSNHKQVLQYINYTMAQNPEFNTLSFAYPNGSYMGISHTVDGGMLKKIANPKTDRVFYTYELPSNRLINKKTNYDARERPWFVQAKASKRPIWSTVFEMYSDGKLGVTYAEALRKNNKFYGVVGTDIVFNDLNEQLDKIRLTQNSYLFILDADDNIIAQSDLAETHKGSETLHSVSESNNSLLQQAVKYIYEHDSVKAYDFHGGSLFDVDGVKQDYFVNFIPYGYDEGLDWHIGVVIPKSDFLGHINEVRRNTFIIWFISFILSIVLGLAITYLINNTIKRLHNKLSEIEITGSMYYHDDDHKIKEVNDLSEAFSRMSRRLHESYLELQLTNDALENTVVENTKALKKANTELLKESQTDELTNLVNRRSFNHFLEFYWHNLSITRVDSLSLLICDIDYFKQYNDTYGAGKGDECIQKFAKILQNSVTELEVVTRISGEVFAIILPNTSENQASVVAEKIMKKLFESKIEHEKSCTSDYITTSIGIVSIAETDSISHHEFISHADKALYLAKQKGKNQYWVYQNE